MCGGGQWYILPPLTSCFHLVGYVNTYYVYIIALDQEIKLPNQVMHKRFTVKLTYLESDKLHVQASKDGSTKSILTSYIIIETDVV